MTVFRHPRSPARIIQTTDGQSAASASPSAAPDCICCLFNARSHDKHEERQSAGGRDGRVSSAPGSFLRAFFIPTFTTLHLGLGLGFCIGELELELWLGLGLGFFPPSNFQTCLTFCHLFPVSVLNHNRTIISANFQVLLSQKKKSVILHCITPFHVKLCTINHSCEFWADHPNKQCNSLTFFP